MLLIFVGKSACGKSTIEKHFEKMVFFTSRNPRNGEIHGKDYYFYNKEMIEETLEKRKKGEETFIIQISENFGNYYGTNKEEVERIKNKDLVIAVMNLEGAKDMKEIMKENGIETKIIWIEIDEEIRLQRLMGRTQDTNETEEQIKERLNEDFRNKDKEEVDIIIENNGSLEEVLNKIHALVN